MAKTNPVEFVQEVARKRPGKSPGRRRKETMITTVMVMIMVALASVFFLVVDCHSEMGRRQVCFWASKGCR